MTTMELHLKSIRIRALEKQQIFTLNDELQENWNVNEEITEEKRNNSHWMKMENTTYKILWNIVEAGLRGKFITPKCLL